MSVVVACALLAACGAPHAASPSSTGHRASSADVLRNPATTASTAPRTTDPRVTHPTHPAPARPAPTTTAPPPTVATTATTAPPTTTTAPPPPPTTTSTAGSFVDSLIGVDGARQVIAVVAGGYGDTTATLTAYQKGVDGWTQVFGPWQAEIGEAGFAPPGEKVEGDLRTPSGSYGFLFFFGVDSEPSGITFPWRSISSSDVWNDDPSSPYYNQWIDEATQGVDVAGADPEPMYDVPDYDYGAVIEYNMFPVSHTPPDGSAIFFHYSTVPTVGCVALPDVGELVEVLRWLNPSDDPRIIMGTESAVVS